MSKRKGLSRNWQYVGLSLLAVVTIAAVIAVFNRPMPVASSPEPRLGAAVESTPTPTEDPAPVVAFIGDSYAAGTGASSTNERWTTLLSDELGWIEENFARGGTGYVASVTDNAQMTCGLDYCPSYPEMIEDVIEADPDIVFVSGGRNDGGQLTDALAASINDLYSTLRAELPDAKIIGTNPVWAADDRPVGADAVSAAVKDAVKAADGTYVNVGQPLEGKPELISEDGVHPNNDGHQVLAEVTAEAVKNQTSAG